jgi:hypothetical protein
MTADPAFFLREVDPASNDFERRLVSGPALDYL